VVNFDACKRPVGAARRLDGHASAPVAVAEKNQGRQLELLARNARRDADVKEGPGRVGAGSPPEGDYGLAATGVGMRPSCVISSTWSK
jgi:hypothetical protein